MVKINLCCSAIVQNCLSQFLSLFVVVTLQQILNILLYRIGFFQKLFCTACNSDHNAVSHLCSCHIQNDLLAAGHTVCKAGITNIFQHGFTIHRNSDRGCLLIGRRHHQVKPHRKVIAQAELLIAHLSVCAHNLFQPGNHIRSDHMVTLCIGVQAVVGVNTEGIVKFCTEMGVIHQIQQMYAPFLTGFPCQRNKLL